MEDIKKNFSFSVKHQNKNYRVGLIQTHRGEINTPAFMPVGTQATVKGVFINDIIKTETYEENLELYMSEGLTWAKKKYGFNSRWQMMQYSKLFYDNFFEYFPEEKKNKI